MEKLAAMKSFRGGASFDGFILCVPIVLPSLSFLFLHFFFLFFFFNVFNIFPKIIPNFLSGKGRENEEKKREHVFAFRDGN